MVIADSIAQKGISATYLTLGNIANHPPLVGVVVLGCVKLAQLLSVPFLVIFKLLGVTSDLVTWFLLFNILRPHLQRDNGLILYALNPVAIAISSYHGNTDSIYTACTLASAFAAASNRAFLSGGLFALAVNIKLIPLLILPALLLFLEKRDGLGRFASGAAFAVIPFVCLGLWAGTGVLRPMFGYQPTVERWGIQGFLREMFAGGALPGDPVPSPIMTYRAAGGGVVLLSSIAIAYLGLRVRKIGFYRTMGCIFAAFLLLTPGFGLQYFACLMPFLILAGTEWAILLSLPIGYLCTAAYVRALDPRLPLFSCFPTLEGPLRLLGFLTWLLIGVFLIRTLFYGKTIDEES